MQSKKSETKNTKTKEKVLQKHDIIFDEFYAKTLIDNEEIAKVEAYVKQFFFRYKKDIFVFDGLTFDLYSQLDATKMIPNDLSITFSVPDEATKKFKTVEFSVSKYLKSTDFMKDNYKPIIDFTKPKIFKQVNTIRGVKFEEHFLNMAKPYKIDINSPMVEITPFIKDQLQKIDDHLFNVLCSKNKKSFEFNKNFFACTFAGRKLRKCLYWQSAERSGKGIFLNDLIKPILGDSMYKTSSVETITTYTKPFEGCVLVNADELPVEGSNWKCVADKLKGLITEPDFDSRTMHQTAYPIKNTFNMIITTNNNAVTLSQTNNKRYHTNDIDESRIGDIEYFKMMTKVVANPTVRLAYYQQMMIHYATLTNWNEDEDELTVSKQAKMVEALPQFHKYIKEHYVLKGRGISERTNIFFDTYFKTTNDKTSKIQIGKYLNIMGIESKKFAGTPTMGQHYKYIISKSDLYKSFFDKKWLDPNVDHVNDECSDEEDEEENVEIPVGGVKGPITEMIAKSEYDLLKQKLERYEQIHQLLEIQKDITATKTKMDAESNEVAKMKLDKKKPKCSPSEMMENMVSELSIW